MPEQAPEDIARRLCAELRLPDARPVPARDGREHHLFRVRTPPGACGPDDPGGERLLKFPRVDALPDPFDRLRPTRDRLLAEAEAVRQVRAVGVPNPYRLFDTEPVCVLMGILPGTTAEIAYERGQLDLDSLLGVCLRMGRTLSEIHGRRRPDTPSPIPDLPGADPASARLLHLDYHLGNVIGWPRLGSTWTIAGVVDWTCARWGPVEADLVEMQLGVFIQNPRARDALVAGYRQASGRAIDMTNVETRAAAEMRRRLEHDRPADERLIRVWEGWLERRR